MKIEDALTMFILIILFCIAVILFKMESNQSKLIDENEINFVGSGINGEKLEW